ncbi:MAG TPA: hypothetical protein PLD47_08295 [Aggregatilineales bacterium]|nr:hypothetical protein [Anaerolineales bacterium]HRE47710.1 hypothetical protein [Aggregatilineales bacterium]
MKSFIRTVILITLCSLILVFPLIGTRAQDDGCNDLVIKALETTSANCLDIGRGEACYGNVKLSAEARDDVPTDQFVFNQPKDRVKVETIKTLKMNPLDLTTAEWGVSYMRIRANLPDTAAGQFVTVLMFGDTQVRDASVELNKDTGSEAPYTPMQAFYFRTGIGDAKGAGQCNQFPTSGVLIQTPKGGQKINLLVNEVELSVGSTILLESPGEPETLGELADSDGKEKPDNAPSEMRITTFEGEAKVTVNGVTTVVGPGQQARVELDENSRPVSEPTTTEYQTESGLNALINLVIEAADKNLIEFEGIPATATPAPTPDLAANSTVVEGVLALSGSGQTAVIGEGYTQPLRVRVVNAAGNPVSGVSVTFSTPNSGASATFASTAFLPLGGTGVFTRGGGMGLVGAGNTATVLSGADGVATSPLLIANDTPGTFTATAQDALSGAQTSFTLTNMSSNAVASVTPTGGSGQSTTVNSTFAGALTVRVANASGSPLSGIAVVFSAPTGGASGVFNTTGTASQTVVTNINGIAQSSLFTANGTAGSYSVIASVGTISGFFSLTNTPAGNPVPSISSLSPANTDAGSNGFDLTVYGSNFVAGSVVRWNGSDRTTTFINSGQLSATILGGDVASVGTATVTVFNPAPGGGISNGVTFTIDGPPNPVPTLSSITPTNATAGTGGFTLTVYGTDFIPGSVVRWNGSNRGTTYVSDTELTASISAADIAAAGNATVTVFTSAPGGGTSNPALFTIDPAPNPVPNLSTISPNSATAGASGFTLTVSGSNFIPGSVVRWNGSARGTTYNSSTQLTASIPASDVASAGSATVTVFNPGPGGGISGGATFTINPPPNPVPALSGISPSSATAGDPGFTLVVNGSNFVLGAVVNWNGSGRGTTFINSGQLEAYISAADIANAGAASVRVFNPGPGGGLSNAVNFTINPVPPPPPTLSGLSPSDATAGDGDFTMTVTGANFIPGATVLWDGAGLPTTWINSTTLQASVSAERIANPGSVTITVVNPNLPPGQGISNPQSFSIYGE